MRNWAVSATIHPIEVDPNQTLNTYQAALSNLDSDGPQYITSNTLDEMSHATFLNAYLESRGAEPVNFDRVPHFAGKHRHGIIRHQRLTNLMHLNVDTSWYVRYRSATNPDFGATFPQALKLNGRYRDSQKQYRLHRYARFHSPATPYSGDRQYSGLSLWIHRARRLESLRSHESESDRIRKYLRSPLALVETRSLTSWNGSILRATECKRLWRRLRTRYPA